MFERCDCQLSRLNAASASSPYTSISAPLACSIVAREAMALRTPVATSRPPPPRPGPGRRLGQVDEVTADARHGVRVIEGALPGDQGPAELPRRVDDPVEQAEQPAVAHAGPQNLPGLPPVGGMGVAQQQRRGRDHLAPVKAMDGVDAVGPLPAVVARRVLVAA